MESEKKKEEEEGSFSLWPGLKSESKKKMEPEFLWPALL